MREEACCLYCLDKGVWDFKSFKIKSTRNTTNVKLEKWHTENKKTYNLSRCFFSGYKYAEIINKGEEELMQGTDLYILTEGKYKTAILTISVPDYNKSVIEIKYKDVFYEMKCDTSLEKIKNKIIELLNIKIIKTDVYSQFDHVIK